jgi:hypothetical protein
MAAKEVGRAVNASNLQPSNLYPLTHQPLASNLQPLSAEGTRLANKSNQLNKMIMCQE